MSEKLSQELVKLATIHSHTMTVSDLMDAAAIVAERDQLRAELAAAKEKADKAGFNLADAKGEIAVLSRKLEGCQATGRALAADNERLRAALELSECYMKVFRRELARNNATFEGSEDQAEVDGDLAKVQAALAATPAQSLAGHDAALLRCLAAKLDGEGHPANEYYRNWLMAEAERTEKEA